ncbi:MAG: hypothetical protein ACTSYM_06860 [Candidatus Baldrarchaeia archaeon]
MNLILHVEREDKGSEHVMIIKTVLTKNFNSIIIAFDKKKVTFCIQIGDERVLMYPSEFGELIDILETVYKTVRKRYLPFGTDS